MVEIFTTPHLLALFFIFLVPIPWAVSAIHVLVIHKYWQSTFVKTILISLVLISWFLVWRWIFYELNIELFLQSVVPFGIIQNALGGFILLIAAFIEFQTMKTLGMRRVLGSSEFKSKKDQLITSGIYHYLRHPRYLEHPLWALGLGLFFDVEILIFFFLYLLFSFAVTAYFEEQELIQRYGQQYIEYKKKTPSLFFSTFLGSVVLFTVLATMGFF